MPDVIASTKEKLIATVTEAIDQLEKQLVDISPAVLAAYQNQAQSIVAAFVQQLEELFRRLNGDMVLVPQQVIQESITESMQHLYRDALNDSGKGVVARTQQLFVAAFTDLEKGMYEEAIQQCEHGLQNVIFQTIEGTTSSKDSTFRAVFKGFQVDINRLVLGTIRMACRPKSVPEHAKSSYNAAHVMANTAIEAIHLPDPLYVSKITEAKPKTTLKLEDQGVRTFGLVAISKKRKRDLLGSKDSPIELDDP